jgi:hypothetical protein
MILRKFCAHTALAFVALANLAHAQTPKYKDGSEADVYYYADDSKESSAAYYDGVPLPPEKAQHITQYSVAGKTVYEPGFVEPSSFGHRTCDSCGTPACRCNDYDATCFDEPCSPIHGLWGRGEYLMWWMSGATAPPLVTTSPDGTPITDAGILPDAEILFPTDRLGIEGRPGGRFTLGYWFDDAESLGIEGNYFFLDKGGDGFQGVSSDEGSPILARPIIDAETGLEDAILVSYPDVFAGSINVASSSDVLGAEANIRKMMANSYWGRMDLLAGYRFIRVNESLNVYENQVSIDPGGIIPLGTQISIQDNFITRNQFNGGQVGMILQKEHRRWTLEGVGKVAFGSWNQQVRIGGYTSIAVPNVPVVVEEGGVLALASNSGNFQRDRFAAIPEIGLNLRYQLTECCKLSVGYTMIYLSHIVRPGNNVDRQIDLDQLPPVQGPGDYPMFRFKESDAWLQGLNLGLECRF